MLEAIKEALHEVAAIVPLLLIIYAALELLEKQLEGRLKDSLVAARNFGPLIGALLGCIPQCGFSVIATALYAQRVVSRGTLLAVYLSTSDEALPLLLAQPQHGNIILPLLLTKVIIAVAAGYATDLLQKRRAATSLIPHDPACECLETRHCCGPHHAHGPWWRQFLIAPIRHTATVIVFIFLVSVVLNIAVIRLGDGGLAQLMLPHSVWQPALAVLIGLIPNCAASVALTQVFLHGGISFGSVVAGLLASAGMGTLLLVKETRTSEALEIIGEMAAISFASGALINLFMP